MSNSLPGRPHLEHLKKQAKQLLASHRRGDSAARKRFAAHLPAYTDRAPLKLHDAQSVIAREHGSESWARLRDEVRMRVRLPDGEATHTLIVPAVGEKVRPADRHINCIRFTPEGDTLVSAGMDGRIRLWRSSDWKIVREVQAHPKSANTISFHHDGAHLTTGCTDGLAGIWDWPSMERTASLPAKTGAASWFAPLGDRMLSVGLNGRVHLWSWPDLARVAQIRAHPKKMTGHTFSPDGEELVTCGLEGAIARTSLATGETVDTRAVADKPIVNVRFVPGTDRILIAEYGGNMRLLSWPDLEPIADTQTPAGIGTIEFHPSEDVFALCIDHGVEIRSNDTLELLRSLEIPAKGVYTLAFSPDDRWLAAAGADQRIRVWSMQE